MSYYDISDELRERRVSILPMEGSLKDGRSAEDEFTGYCAWGLQ